MYYLGEYINMITVSALAALLFFGGWYLWIVPPILAFLLKIVLFLFLYIWLRGTFPRLRYDMLMRLGWKVLLPLAIANVILTRVVLVATQGETRRTKRRKPSLSIPNRCGAQGGPYHQCHRANG